MWLLSLRAIWSCSASNPTLCCFFRDTKSCSIFSCIWTKAPLMVLHMFSSLLWRIASSDWCYPVGYSCRECLSNHYGDPRRSFVRAPQWAPNVNIEMNLGSVTRHGHDVPQGTSIQLISYKKGRST